MSNFHERRTDGYHFWSFNNTLEANSGLDPKLCDSIVASAENNFDEALLMPNNKLKSGFLKERVRKGNTYFDSQPWVYDLIWPYLHLANESAEWNFEISAAENYQISKYTPGDFYTAHLDSLGTHTTKFNSPDKEVFHDKTRKISLSVNLNDPSEYEGGELKIFGVPKTNQEIGTLNFFPSYLPHEVTPVTKGVRYSLVMWFLGYPFQ